MDKNIVTDNDKQRDKYSKMLIWACFFMYVFMMGSKNAYTAEMVTLQGVFGKTKAEISLAMTFYFVTYAIGQLILSALMGKINLKIYLTITASVSAILTILIAFMGTIEPIYVLCAVNGALQAGIYSGCMQVIAKNVEQKFLPMGNKVMSFGSAIAGAISYGVPALFVELGMWYMPFIVLGIIFLISAIFFFYSVSKMKKFPPIITEEGGKIISHTNEKPFMQLPTKGSKISFFVVMAILTILGNTTHYALMNWIPNLLHEVFFMPQSYSILITLLVPLLMAIFNIIVVNLCEKYKNILALGTVFLVVALLILFPMLFFYNVNIILTLVCLVLFIGITNGARQVIGGVLAFKMRTEINSGSFLAFKNAFAAFAAGIIPPIAGSVIETLGYGTLFILVFAVAFIEILIMTIWSIKQQRKFLEHREL